VVLLFGIAIFGLLTDLARRSGIRSFDALDL